MKGSEPIVTTQDSRTGARGGALVAEEPQTFTGTVVLGCGGAGSTIRELTTIPMEDPVRRHEDGQA